MSHSHYTRHATATPTGPQDTRTVRTYQHRERTKGHTAHSHTRMPHEKVKAWPIGALDDAMA